MYAESMATSLSTTPLIPEPKLNTEIPHYDLFTSFRYDPKLLTLDFNTAVNGTPLPYLLFPYHVARLVDAANVFGWPSAIQRANAPGFAETLRKTCDDAVKSCLLPEKEQGLGVSRSRILFLFSFESFSSRLKFCLKIDNYFVMCGV